MRWRNHVSRVQPDAEQRVRRRNPQKVVWGLSTSTERCMRAGGVEGPDCASKAGPSAGNGPPELIAEARGGVRVPPEPLGDIADWPPRVDGLSDVCCLLAYLLDVLLLSVLAG